MIPTTLKVLSIWFGILIFAFINGGLRELVLIPKLGGVSGFVLSAVLLSTIIISITYFSIPWLGQLPITSYLMIGVSWLCLTVAFEFSFGYVVQHKSWVELLSAYTFTGGNLWPLVLVVLGVAPLMVAKLRGFA